MLPARKIVWLIAMLLVFGFPHLVRAQDTSYPVEGEQIPGPKYTSPDEIYGNAEQGMHKGAWEEWLKDLKHYRMEHLLRAGYHDEQYKRPELLWTQSSFVQPQMMIHDRYFYDPLGGRYTVDRYLDDLDRRYGGIDAVLVWQDYPNIGIDHRNQYDMIRDMPGGIEGLKQMVADFHRRGVRVLFPVMMWDQGTRDEGVPNWTATARLLAEIGADGVNGDTTPELPYPFRQASDDTGHPLAFEPEGTPPDPSEALAWNNMSWGYWKFPWEPMISQNKWLETRHMVNVCDRWNRDKTNDLQFAFFNGVGFESWENVWGIWNQLTPRDAETLRRMAKIERVYAPLLVSAGWEPFTPVRQYGIFASKFPGDGAMLWTIVNRTEYDVTGKQITTPHQDGMRYYDLWHGVELKPEVSGGKATLSFDIEGNGSGAVLAVAGEPDAKLQKLLAEMKVLARQPLHAFSLEWKFLPQHLVDVPATKPAASTPEGMVRIPDGDFLFDVHGIMIEGSNGAGVDVQYPWEDSPRRFHHHTMHLPAFYMDTYPVTNADFEKFLNATHYHPKDDHNFLRDWKNGAYPTGAGNKPVTWVSLEDAQAYARWAGKRLPREWEWQYAAQGSDGRQYPWGNDWDASAVPEAEHGRDLPPAADVNAHPKGASPFGVMDMVGNVWQWTDEFRDDHTRAGILRGGSHYRPAGSLWYFPEAYRLNEHGKLLLMAPSIDRAGTVGFRCVVDAP